jgi:hypothetical protein
MGRFFLLDPAFQQDGTASQRWSALTRREFFAATAATAGALLASGCVGSDDTEAQVSDGTAASNSDASVSTQAVTAAATTAPTAVFVGTDSVTLGSWRGRYGADGATIVGDSVRDPAYAHVTSSGASPFIWAQSTNNAKALMKAASSDRIASCWYATDSFTIDVNITDARSHRIAFYCMDWSALGRVQTIDALDPATGTVLDTRTLSSFTAGQYLIWDITGYVRFRLTCRAGPNAIVNGLFFGAPTAVFVATDSVTLGSWKGRYGADGATIVGDSVRHPAYAQTTTSSTSTWIWAQSTTNARALMKAASSDRIASCWYATGSFTIDVNITDASRHRIALYFIDWSALGRVQTIDVLDAATGTVLDTRTLSSFTAGQYLIWDIAGYVRFRLTCRAGPNAIVNGLFFGGATPTPAPPPPPPPPPPPAATYNISVSWTTPLRNTDGSSLTDIAGYVVRYGTSPSNLSKSLPQQGAGVTSATITGLPAGTYYIAVATVNSAGITSGVSNAASKTVP